MSAIRFSTLVVVCFVLFGACGGGTTADGGTGGGSAAGGGTAAGGGSGGGNAMQEPPTTGAADVEAWLALGYYKQWHCEAASHEARSPSPHGINRICNNMLVQSQPLDGGEYPVGAANVKELYTTDGGTEIIGYAVEVHISAGTNTSNWYWYEKNPSLGAPAKYGEAGLVADGVGPNEGVAGTVTDMICTSCHEAAGSDAAHNTTNSHDFVYTHIP